MRTCAFHEHMAAKPNRNVSAMMARPRQVLVADTNFESSLIVRWAEEDRDDLSGVREELAKEFLWCMSGSKGSAN